MNLSFLMRKKGSSMKLDYGTLLSFSPIKLQCGCSIRSPLLRELSELTFPTYHSYLASLLIDIESYYNGIDSNEFEYYKNYTRDEQELIRKIRSEYESMTEEEQSTMQPIDILSFDPKFIGNISKALSFFIQCDVHYSPDYQAFIHIEDKAITCAISRTIYAEVIDIILQRNGIQQHTTNQNKPKFKTKLAEKLYLRTLKAESTKDKSNDKHMEIPNILSSVAAKHNSLNIINIWDITIYQLYDQFKRLQNNSLFEIQSLSVAAWGDEKNKFDPAGWYKNLNYEN